MATTLHALYQVMHYTYAAMYGILRNMFVLAMLPKLQLHFFLGESVAYSDPLLFSLVDQPHSAVFLWKCVP
jgi:hypothetical protein